MTTPRRHFLHDRVRDVLTQLTIADAQGHTVDHGRISITQGRGGHGKHGTTTLAPPRVSSLAVEWTELLASALVDAESDAAGTGRRSGPGGGRKRRIIQSEIYRGRPCEFVAFLEGCSADLVRKARGEHGLDA
jgi:hypothetical protein